MPSCRLLRNTFFVLFFSTLATVAVEFGYVVWQLDTLANAPNNHSWGCDRAVMGWVTAATVVSIALAGWHAHLLTYAYDYFDLGSQASQVRVYDGGVVLVVFRCAVGVTSGVVAVYSTPFATPVYEVLVSVAQWHLGCAAWVVCLLVGARALYGRTFGTQVSAHTLNVLFENGSTSSTDSERTNEFLDTGSLQSQERRSAVVMSDLWSAL